MPEYLHLPPVAQGVLAISAVALAVVRLLTASKPFWAWEKVPVWVQKLLPALLMAVAALPTAIEHARSWLDIVVGFVVTGSMWFTASRGDKRSTPPTDDQLEETVHFGPPLLVLLLAGLSLSQQACHAPLPCNEDKMRAIDKAYLVDLGKACLAYPTAQDCPEYPALRAKHESALEACPQ